MISGDSPHAVWFRGLRIEEARERDTSLTCCRHTNGNATGTHMELGGAEEETEMKTSGFSLAETRTERIRDEPIRWKAGVRRFVEEEKKDREARLRRFGR